MTAAKLSKRNPEIKGRRFYRTGAKQGNTLFVFKGMALLLASGFLWGTVAGGGTAAAHAPERHQVGLVSFQPPVSAPDFALQDPDNRSLRLSDFRGRYVLLNFWATWCPPCVREMPSMEKLSAAFKERPFAVLAVSLDAEGAEKVVPFLKRLGITFPVALDPESRVSAVYGAKDLPATFLIDPQGRVIAAAKGEQDWASAEMVRYLDELISSGG